MDIPNTPLTHDVVSIVQGVITGEYEIPEWTTSVMKRAYEPTLCRERRPTEVHGGTIRVALARKVGMGLQDAACGVRRSDGWVARGGENCGGKIVAATAVCASSRHGRQREAQPASRALL